MLVLSRMRDEVLMIGDDIKITVVDIRGDKVRLGVDAPRTMPVHRKEVYDAIRREGRASPAYTEKQKELRRKHGTPAEFAAKCYAAVPGECSMDEARAAVEKYNQEWEAAK